MTAPPPDPHQEQLVTEPATTTTRDPRQRRGARLRAYVVRAGGTLVAVRAWDETDAVERVVDQFRLSYLVGVAEDITVRLAGPDDLALLERFEGGSQLFRSEWAHDAYSQDPLISS